MLAYKVELQSFQLENFVNLSSNCLPGDKMFSVFELNSFGSYFDLLIFGYDLSVVIVLKDIPVALFHAYFHYFSITLYASKLPDSLVFDIYL